MDKNKVHLLKTNYELKSKQIDDETDNLFTAYDNIIEPSFDFDILLQTYDCSSIISWIIWKIAIKTASNFVKTENKKLNEVLENLDIESIALDMMIFWNAYFERLTTRNKEKTLDFKHIIVPTFRVSNEKNKKDFYQRSVKGKNKVWFNKNEILQFKRNSIASRYYGDSIFSSSIDEIILLSYITSHFKRFFKSGNINPTVLFDENNSLNDEQVEKIENLIKDRIAGVENADTTVFISSKIWKIDLATIFDPEKYISLKRELKEDIAIDLNIPFDLLSSKNSNRANSEVAMSLLYDDIIIPLQKRILKQLKSQFKKWFNAEKEDECWKDITLDDINAIEFENINLADPYKEMQTLTWYQKNGVLNVNEVRNIANLWEDIEWGDEYKIIEGKNDKEMDEDKQMEKIQNDIKKIYETNKNS